MLVNLNFVMLLGVIATPNKSSAFSEKAPEIPAEPSPTPEPEEEEEPTLAGPCDDIISAAEGALESCKQSNKAKDDVIFAQDVAIETLMRQRQEALEQIDVKGATPFWLWLVVGVAAGVVLEGARR